MLLWVPLFLFGASVSLEVLPDTDNLAPDKPVEGTVIVTYPSDKKLDVDSFAYQKRPLKVDFVKRVEISGNDPLNVDSFRFSLPPLSVGLARIQPIEVKVGGNLYSSPTVAVEIKPRVKSQVFEKGSGAAGVLKIETIFVPNGPLYPGQKGVIGYRYSFKGNIELQEETLPLLDQNLFLKLGEKEIEEREEGDLSIREVKQEVEFKEAGTFDVKGAKVVGYGVSDKGWGPKTYFEPALVSTTPDFKVEVLPFPEAGKPPFFTGALGPFTLETGLEPISHIERGDRLNFHVRFGGEGVHSTLKAINLLCLPGWAGFFRVGDLPPEERGRQKGGNKTTLYSYEIIPLTPFASAIPPVWMAYFDPHQKKYVTLKSDPIPLTVVAGIQDKIPLLPQAESLLMKPLLPIPAPPLTLKQLEEKLNQTLLPFLVEETDSEPTDASYYEQLGRAYEAMERSPEAIWAYQKSLTLNPWNPSTQAALFALQEKRGLPQEAPKYPPNFLVYLIFAMGFVAALLFWRRKPVRTLGGAIALSALVWMGISTWILPLQGILLEGVDMTLFPSLAAPKVSETPLPAGLRVKVLDYEEEGEWLKVQDPSGQVGFVPFSVIKVI
jgi:hypothetical protein